jgi:hypothetical protein
MVKAGVKFFIPLGGEEAKRRKSRGEAKAKQRAQNTDFSCLYPRDMTIYVRTCVCVLTVNSHLK